MSNKHIKTINGRKYYYESIRIGDKVTSRYIEPVRRKKPRRTTWRKGLCKNHQEPHIASANLGNRVKCVVCKDKIIVTSSVGGRTTCDDCIKKGFCMYCDSLVRR